MYMCISAYGRDVFEHEQMAAECLGEGGVCMRERERDREGERQGEREEDTNKQMLSSLVKQVCV